MEIKKDKVIIDVSSYQGVIDWDKIKAEGVDQVIMRATTRNGQPDTRLAVNFHSARGVGYVPEFYKFMYSRDAGAAYEEFNKTITAVKEITGLNHFMMWADLETYDNNRFSKNEALRALMGAQLACKTRECYFGIYCNYDYLNNVMSYVYDREHMDVPIWLARYNDKMGDIGKFNVVMWQYTSKGIIPGIPGYVDLSEYV